MDKDDLLTDLAGITSTERASITFMLVEGLEVLSTIIDDKRFDAWHDELLALFMGQCLDRTVLEKATVSNHALVQGFCARNLREMASAELDIRKLSITDCGTK